MLRLLADKRRWSSKFTEMLYKSQSRKEAELPPRMRRLRARRRDTREEVGSWRLQGRNMRQRRGLVLSGGAAAPTEQLDDEGQGVERRQRLATCRAVYCSVFCAQWLCANSAPAPPPSGLGTSSPGLRGEAASSSSCPAHRTECNRKLQDSVT